MKDAPIIIENIPEFSEIKEKGLGEYLNPLNKLAWNPKVNIGLGILECYKSWKEN